MQKWEYLSVSLRGFWAGDAFRVRSVNRREQEDWRHGPTLDEYLNQLGNQDWELIHCDGEVAHPSGTFFFFKRPKS